MNQYTELQEVSKFFRSVILKCNPDLDEKYAEATTRKLVNKLGEVAYPLKPVLMFFVTALPSLFVAVYSLNLLIERVTKGQYVFHEYMMALFFGILALYLSRRYYIAFHESLRSRILEHMICVLKDHNLVFEKQGLLSGIEYLLYQRKLQIEPLMFFQLLTILLCFVVWTRKDLFAVEESIYAYTVGVIYLIVIVIMSLFYIVGIATYYIAPNVSRIFIRLMAKTVIMLVLNAPICLAIYVIQYLFSSILHFD